MSKKEKLRPYMRQFYRGNGWRFTLAMVQTLLLTGANIMISWLIQQIIDLTTGADIGFSFTQILILTLVGLGLEIAAFTFA